MVANNIDIVQERTNTHRLAISNRIPGVSAPIVISVEGLLDIFWLKPIIAKEKNGKPIVIERQPGEGKEEVIQRVVSGDSHFGIVDMDHDFRGSEISVPNICDTRKFCCTFGIIFDNLDTDKITNILKESVEKSEKKSFKGWISDSPEKASRVPEIARVATKLRLFCGWASIPGLSWTKPKLGENLQKQWYEGIWNGDFDENMALETIIEKIRGERISQKLSEFEKEFSDLLQFCGTSDHELEFTIKQWLSTKQFGFNKDGFHQSIKKLSIAKNSAPWGLISQLKSWNVLAE